MTETKSVAAQVRDMLKPRPYAVLDVESRHVELFDSEGGTQAAWSDVDDDDIEALRPLCLTLASEMGDWLDNPDFDQSAIDAP